MDSTTNGTMVPSTTVDPNYVSPSSDVNLRNFIYSMITVNAMSAFVSVVFNLLIIAAFVKNSSLRTPSFVLILSLVISDFGVGGVVQVSLCIWLNSLFDTVYKESKLEPIFKVYHLSSNALISASLFTMTFITIDRFLALRLHVRYQIFITARKYYIVLAIIWVLSLSWSIGVYRTAFFIIILIAIIASLTHVILLILISREIKRHSRLIQVRNVSSTNQPSISMLRYKRSVKTLYYIMGSFVLCYFPYWTFHVVRFATKMKGVQSFYANITLLTVIYANSFINPFIYCWRIREIRAAVLEIIGVH